MISIELSFAIWQLASNSNNTCICFQPKGDLLQGTSWPGFHGDGGLVFSWALNWPLFMVTVNPFLSVGLIVRVFLLNQPTVSEYSEVCQFVGFDAVLKGFLTSRSFKK